MQTHFVYEEEEMSVAGVEVGYTQMANEYVASVRGVRSIMRNLTYPQCPTHRCGQSGCCIGAHILGTAAGALCVLCPGSSWGTEHLHKARK